MADASQCDGGSETSNASPNNTDLQAARGGFGGSHGGQGQEDGRVQG